MKLKKFNDYLVHFSKDPKNFEKKVMLYGSSKGPDIFRLADESNESINNEHPIILWGKGSLSNNFNESHRFTFNSKELPHADKIHSDLEGASFLPKSTKDRSKVKGLQFPIVGVNGQEKKEFKTYGKFKKSEEAFPLFREKIVPVTRFNVIAFKAEPLHIQEKIRTIGFDIDSNRFSHADQLKEIVEKLNETYPLDFYHLSLLESGDRLYFEDLDASTDLSPSQSIKMYEKAYESFYEAKLPEWFKNQLFEKYVKPYYKSRHYDSLLIKPKHSIDFKKYLD